ncbi:MAG: hypothetical protein IT366_00980 [Candidatus Hydrogenedentes bacterium]|nr:hypothetical protein [Candidatus Hydrogenedentota bacterium]
MRGTLTPEIEAAIAAQEDSGSSYVQCDPQLVEMAVLAVVRGAPMEREYQDAREACYEIEDTEARECAFAALNQEWFTRLRLAAPVLNALKDCPNVSARTARCILAPSFCARDECAELYGHASNPSAGQPTLTIRLRPESFARSDYVTRLLRHELMHISDMLEPAFGYDPSAAQFLTSDGVPTVIRDRYRVLWDTYIDGRLHHEGHRAGSSHEQRRTEFCLVFRMLESLAIAAFDTVFAATALTHRQLIDFSRHPKSILEPHAAVR